MAAEETPVLIVGAGPVGLALAGDLGWRGIPTILVEQSDGLIEQPRMDLVGIRTMEFCRRWGLVDAVANCPYPQDYGQDFAFVTSITGHEMVRERRPSRAQAKPPAFSPQRRERCPQNMFDPILRDFAESFSTNDLRYRHRLTGIAQDGDGVAADVENLATGATATIRARYVAGCDGAGSLVRSRLGVPLEGNPALTYSLNVLIRCPTFNQLHDKGDVYRYILIGRRGVWATMVAIDGRDNWRFQYVGSKETLALGEPEIRELINRAFGRPFEFEILSIMPWTRRQLVAESYRKGDAFLVGDAAHQMSPTGGFGMNTGIGDAVDLSWKLAAALDGWGGPFLLDSYDLERRPVGQRNVDEAAGNLGRMIGEIDEPAILDDTPEGDATRRRIGQAVAAAMEREYRADGIHVGYRYDDSPICVPGRDADAAGRSGPLHPNRPAGRARPARVAARRTVDARPVRPGLRPARPRPRRPRCRADSRRRTPYWRAARNRRIGRRRRPPGLRAPLRPRPARRARRLAERCDAGGYG